MKKFLLEFGQVTERQKDKIIININKVKNLSKPLLQVIKCQALLIKTSIQVKMENLQQFIDNLHKLWLEEVFNLIKIK
jgi:hypothetical protein